MPIQGRSSTIESWRVRRVEFALDEFVRTLDEHGYRARWTKAMLCPNRDSEQDDHHVINCELCDTNGFVYFDPIDMNVLVTSYGTKQLFMPESRYEPGTAYFTSLPAHKLSFWDKVELLTATTRYSEVKRTATTGLSYTLKYPVVAVERCVTSRGTVIPLVSIVLHPDGSITLPSALDGDFFSISYFYHPTYIMIDMLHSVRDSRITLLSQDQEVDFPTQAVGRLDFLVRDEAAG